MDKKIAGLLGAVAAVATVGGAQASTAPASDSTLAARSYADLLSPIPDATAALMADNARLTAKPAEGVQFAQYHHHHHHHQRAIVVPRNRHQHHQHHHHHHHGVHIGVPGVGGVVIR